MTLQNRKGTASCRHDCDNKEKVFRSARERNWIVPSTSSGGKSRS